MNWIAYLRDSEGMSSLFFLFTILAIIIIIIIIIVVIIIVIVLSYYYYCCRWYGWFGYFEGHFHFSHWV